MTVFTKPSIVVKKEEVSGTPLVHENLCDEFAVMNNGTAQKTRSLREIYEDNSCECSSIEGDGVDVTFLALTFPRKLCTSCSKPEEEYHRRLDYQQTQEKIDISTGHPGMPVAWVGRRPSGSLMCLTLAALFMVSVGIICGLLLYRQYLHTTHRYQGFCSIPMDSRQEAQLRWRSDPDVQVFSTFIDNNDAEDTLVEKLDIGDNYEKVLVVDSGRNFEFIHDFTVNLTAIVDDARCFMMTLDPNTLLPPDQLLLGIETGAPFDVSRISTTLRADLDAPRPNLMAAAFLLMDACMDKPTYMLKVDESALVRKRSADQPQREFIQFSGRHVQEIEIGNMAEVLRYEKEGRSGAAPGLQPQAGPGQAPLALPVAKAP